MTEEVKGTFFASDRWVHAVKCEHMLALSRRGGGVARTHRPKRDLGQKRYVALRATAGTKTADLAEAERGRPLALKFVRGRMHRRVINRETRSREEPPRRDRESDTRCIIRETRRAVLLC